MVKQKILILGKQGLVGTNAINYFSRGSQYDVTSLGRKDLDLRNQKLVNDFFSLSRPQIVLLTAANVGGIKYNIENPSTQLIDNIQISTNVIQASLDCGVEKLINFGSNCMYPSGIDYPMDENLLQTGPTEPTNRSYSAYKLATWEMVNAINVQFKKNWLTVIPATIFGPHDNFSLSKAHVIPSLMRRFHDAKLNSSNSILLWGDGSPKREFIFIDDLLDALSLILNKDFISQTINVGSGYEISIKDLALEISELAGFNGKINWDLNSANGATRKILDSNYINSLGWKVKTNFSRGLERTYDWFKHNYESARL